MMREANKRENVKEKRVQVTETNTASHWLFVSGELIWTGEGVGSHDYRGGAGPQSAG